MLRFFAVYAIMNDVCENIASSHTGIDGHIAACRACLRLAGKYDMGRHPLQVEKTLDKILYRSVKEWKPPQKNLKSSFFCFYL